MTFFDLPCQKKIPFRFFVFIFVFEGVYFIVVGSEMKYREKKNEFSGSGKIVQELDFSPSIS